MRTLQLLWSLFVAAVMLASTSFAAPASNVALFRRCYGLVTQSFAEPTHPLLQQVKAGTLDPVTGCLQVLDKGRFSAGRLVQTDTEAKRVLNMFQSLHYSWFGTRDFDTDQPESHRDTTRDLYDISTPGLYFTRALFEPTMNYREIFTSNTTYGAIRANMNPNPGVFTGTPFANYVYRGGTFENVPTGALLGIRSIAPTQTTQASSNTRIYGTYITLFRHFGAGVLGSSPYVTFNLHTPSNQRSNAGVTMPRKWAAAAMKDFLCRDLPLIRSPDALPYVSASAPIAFRQVASCTRCHATIDQMAATVRHTALTTYESGYAAPVPTRPLSGILATIHQGLDQPSESAWPTAVDGNYYRRPTKGRMVLRTFDGRFIDEAVNNLDEYGQKLANLDDPYVCTAVRYWEYFTGVKIQMADFSDPNLEAGLRLSSAEQKHFDEIVRLARSMKTHQKTRTLVEAILRHPAFKDAQGFHGDMQ